MALISKIRNNSWLLIVVIGLALAAFVLMDMTSGASSPFGGGNVRTVGEIEGRKVDYERFVNTENAVNQMLYRDQPGSPLPRREALWNFYVEEGIVLDEAEEIGLGVSDDEFFSAQYGPNYAQIIRQRFPGAQPGTVNVESLNSFKQAIAEGQVTDPAVARYWAHQQNEIYKEIYQTKIGNLVAKGMYTPNWMAETVGAEQNRRIDFAYVQIPFDEIDNNDISLSDADYTSYLNENRARYEVSEETRAAEYVVVDVVPTAKDTATIRQQVASLVTRWDASDNDTTFLQNERGEYDGVYYTVDQLSESIREEAYALPVGSVFGPYLDGNAFRAAKIMGRKVIPDSVTARHILLRFNRETDPIQVVQPILARADSLKTAIESGRTTFSDAAATFSQDASNASGGGDLGTFAPGAMVPEFNNAAFYEDANEIHTVITQFGVHLLEVTNQKLLDANKEESVRLAYVSENIVPSTQTIKEYKNKALELMENNRTLEALRTAVNNDPTLEMQTAPAVSRNDYTIGTLGVDESSREVVREYIFGNDTDKGSVSPRIFSYNDPVNYNVNRYVVVGLSDINEAGMPPLAAVRDQIEPLVANRKKGEMIAQQVASMSDLNAIANKYSVEVDTARQVNFGAAFIGGLGNEPKVLASAFGTGLNNVSKPVVGNSGVYVVKPLTEPGDATVTNLASVRQSNQQSARAGVANRLIQALKKNAEVNDNRSRFF